MSFAVEKIHGNMLKRSGIRKLLQTECSLSELTYWSEDWHLFHSTFEVTGPPGNVERVINVINDWMGNE